MQFKGQAPTQAVSFVALHDLRASVGAAFLTQSALCETARLRHGDFNVNLRRAPNVHPVGLSELWERGLGLSADTKAMLQFKR
jgi:hypothetical protein